MGCFLYPQVYKATGEEFIKIAGGECAHRRPEFYYVFIYIPFTPRLCFFLGPLCVGVQHLWCVLQGLNSKRLLFSRPRHITGGGPLPVPGRPSDPEATRTPFLSWANRCPRLPGARVPSDWGC